MAGKKFSIEAVFSAIDKLSAPIGKIKTKLAGMGKGAGAALRGANAAVNKGLAGLGKLGDAIGVGAVLSVAGLGVAITDTMQKGIEFEASLIRAGAALDVPVRKGTKGFALLADAALKVGASTEHSSLKAAVALNDLATAGYSAEQSIGAVFKIADFASAGTLELADATNIASGTLASFGLRVADATQNTANMGRIMDVLVKAANDSNASVAELYETIKKGGATASASGASIEQFLGAANVLATSGLKGELAGTGLANVFLRLAHQTPVAAKEMKRYGIAVKKSKDGSIDMIATLSNFQKGLGGLGKSQRVAAVNTVFGESAGNAFLKLIEAGPEKLKAYTVSLNSAAGKTAELAKVNREAGGAQLEIFFNKLENLKLEAFKTLGPLIIKVTDAIGEWITKNEELINSTVAEWLTKISESLPEIWKWTVLIVEALAGLAVLAVIVKTITLIVTVVGWLSAAWAALSGVFAAAGAGFGFMVLGPILLVVAALAAVGALIWAFWPEIKSFFSAIADWAVATWGRFWAATVEVFNRFKAFVVGILEFVVGLMIVIWSPVIEWLMGLWDRYVAFLAEVWGRIATQLIAAYGLFLQVWSPIAEFFASLWDGVVANFTEMWGGLVAAATAVYGLFVRVWEPIGAFFTSLWQGIVDNFTGIVGPIIEAITGFVDKVRSVGHAALGEAGAGEAGAGAGAPPQIVSPQARAAAEAADATANASVNGEIRVSAAPGTKATATTKPRSVPIKVAQSGAF